MNSRKPAVVSFVIALGAAASCASTQVNENPAPPPARPALMILVAVAQRRADLLTRYTDLYSGGFKRLLDNGYSFTNAAHDHAVTLTAASDATLSNGA